MKSNVKYKNAIETVTIQLNNKELEELTNFKLLQLIPNDEEEFDRLYLTEDADKLDGRAVIHGKYVEIAQICNFLCKLQEVREEHDK